MQQCVPPSPQTLPTPQLKTQRCLNSEPGQGSQSIHAQWWTKKRLVHRQFKSLSVNCGDQRVIPSLHALVSWQTCEPTEDLWVGGRSLIFLQVLIRGWIKVTARLKDIGLRAEHRTAHKLFPCIALIQAAISRALDHMGNGGAPPRWEREFKGHIRNPVDFLVMWWTTQLDIHRRPLNDLWAPWAIDECNLASQLNRIELMKHFEQSILVIDPYFNLSVYLPYSHMCRIWPEKNPHPRLRSRERGFWPQRWGHL